MILQAVFIYYGMPYFFGVSFKDIWTVSIIVVSVNTGAYMAESVRGGIMSIDPGQFEGARAIGMNHLQTMLYIVLPQTLRNIMPQIGNNYIINVKDTSVMFIIGFNDFFAVHKMVSGAVFKYFPSAFLEMGGYLILTLVASFLLRKMEKRLAGKSNYELVNTDTLTMSAGTYSYPRDAASPFDETSKDYKGEKA
jgi:putative lysine transport system permease protein